MAPNSYDMDETEAPASRERRRRWLWRLSYVLVLLVLLIGLSVLPVGCTTTIVAPEEVNEPATVVLLDHGRHASLVLPAAGGGMTRYAYGDRSWYMGERGLSDALWAMLIPTQATLGRHVLPPPIEPEDVPRRLGVGIEQHWRITVERPRAYALEQHLGGIYQRNIETEAYSRESQLSLVHHPDAYWYFHNSNHVTADWLSRLGCEVDGPAFSSKWRVEEVNP